MDHQSKYHGGVHILSKGLPIGTHGCFDGYAGLPMAVVVDCEVQANVGAVDEFEKVFQ